MKIKLERPHIGQGGGCDGSTETSVQEWADDMPLPAGAVKVPDSTPLQDWKKVEAEKPTPGGSK